MLKAYIRKESVEQEVSIDSDGYSQLVAANRALILLSRARLTALRRLFLLSSHVKLTNVWYGDMGTHLSALMGRANLPGVTRSSA